MLIKLPWGSWIDPYFVIRVVSIQSTVNVDFRNYIDTGCANICNSIEEAEKLRDQVANQINEANNKTC